jgi:hypothetical protein
MQMMAENQQTDRPRMTDHELELAAFAWSFEWLWPEFYEHHQAEIEARSDDADRARLVERLQHIVCTGTVPPEQADAQAEPPAAVEN